VFHHLPKTVYDRGKEPHNSLEAEVVARAVMEHARNSPSLSSVAASACRRRRRSSDHVERLRRVNLGDRTILRAHPFETFFVKNLESVQGDERDVILIAWVWP